MSVFDRRPHLMQVILSLKQGGSETLARDIALGLDPTEFRPSMCLLDTAGPLARQLVEAAIPVHVLGRRPGFDWRLLPRLYRLFRAQRVDIVQTHHLAPLIYSALPARLAGARLVHVEHERFTYENPKARRRLRVLSTLCHRVVVVGSDVRNYLVAEAGIPAVKVGVIPNGVDLGRYTPVGRRSRAACGLPEQGRLIGHVARLDRPKDQATLLRAFALVLESQRDARLVIAGDGPLRADLEALAASLGTTGKVDFLGARQDVPELLPHFAAFALSSVNEGLPLVILEAMAAARPVVSTAVGDMPGIIEDGVAGLLVPPGDPKLLADALIALLERPEWAESMGRSAHSVIEHRFNLESTIAQYRSLYGSLGFKLRPSRV
jgi:glycosyltransferase involved in cell wall biosynthesis